MKLPAHTEITPAAIQAIAQRQGLSADRFELLPATGIINAIYRLGDDLILRVPRNHPAHVDQLRREAVAAPAARAAGVRTPRIIAFDDTCELLPVPYLIVERIPGEALGTLDLEPGATPDVWRELGRDLARLHRGVPAGGLAGSPAEPERQLPDLRPLVDQRVADGWFAEPEARWLRTWLAQLAPVATQPVRQRFTHADVQTTNLMVSPDGHTYRALIDWGCAHWDDPVVDFLAMPFAAVPFILKGHRDLVPLDDDASAEERILWRRLQLLLEILPRGAAPGLSWGERPTAWLVDLFRFFLSPPPGRWRALAPPRLL
jgi:aminoglycoside phosphotransferase (APT) family kinase protein